MKLSQYAKENSVTYRTAWNRAKLGKIPTKTDNTGHIHVITKKESNKNKIAIYARVSSSENKNNLDAQAERLVNYATAKGYQIIHIVKEIANGINDKRPKLIKLLKENDYGVLLVEHKDRLTIFGFNYIEQLFDKDIEVVNLVDDKEEDIIQDFTAIITNFYFKIYGQKPTKKQAEELINKLKNDKLKNEQN